MTELDRRGLLDNTLVIITSDHGEHFGEHRRLSHANSLYRQLLQVPLLIRFPGRVPAGLRIPEPVSLRDLPQTILGLVGVSDSLGFPGASLARYWQETSDSTRRRYVVFSEMFSLRGPRAYSLMADGYHYVKWFGRDPEIYDLDRDPLETADLAATPQGPAIKVRLENLGETFLRGSPIPGE
jgi:arylsulfatase A-like enzyme